MMHVLLVLNKELNKEIRVMVRLEQKWLQKEFKILMREKKCKEAFDLLFSKAEVDHYIPPGSKIPKRPLLTLVEDKL